jgi:Domain of unknown function (DUF4249)
MIRTYFQFAFLVFFSFFLTSCEKDITIKLDPTSTVLVVDGSIENGKYPVVSLSNSLNYFSKLSDTALTNSFVHNAVVTVSNGVVTAQLQEYAARDDSTGILLYYYSFLDSYPGPKFKGTFNTGYSLRIAVDSQVYTSTTTIPPLTKIIDSLWWVPAPLASDSPLVNVKARVVDPPGLGNYTRYYTQVNNNRFYPGLNSVFDDQITDGTTYVVTVDQGVNRNLPVDLNNFSFFNRGDSVTVKLANIDKATYEFWRTMEYNYQSIGNPFSSPTVVQSNISNNALGYFGGYAAQYISVKIPN